MPLLIAILLGVATLLLVIYPLLAPATRADAVGLRASDAADLEQDAKQALRDVDFDYRLGNLEDGDYEALRERYEERALAAMKARYERERALDAIIERQLADVRERLARPANGRKPLGSAARRAAAGTQNAAKSAISPASPTDENAAESATPATPSGRNGRKPARSAMPYASSAEEDAARSATGQERRDGGARLRRRRGA